MSRELWKESRRYTSKLYWDDIAKRLAILLADGTNVEGDTELALRLTLDGCPVSDQTLHKVRRAHGMPNKFQRMQSLKRAAHNMVARQPATEM